MQTQGQEIWPGIIRGRKICREMFSGLPKKRPSENRQCNSPKMFSKFVQPPRLNLGKKAFGSDLYIYVPCEGMDYSVC